MILQKFTDDQLMAELKRRGYYTDNLWQLEDVQSHLDDLNNENETNHTLTDEEKYYILGIACHGDGTMSEIHMQIDWALDDLLQSREED